MINVQRFAFRGVLAGVAVALVFAPNVASADIVNASYESYEDTTGTHPDTYGNWQGDQSRIVSTEAGINPLHGSQMLQFLATTPGGTSAQGGAELWQIIDVSNWIDAIRDGRGVANASAFFNRVGGELSDNQFYIGLFAYAGEASSFPSQWGRSELAAKTGFRMADDNLQTWESAAATLILPTETDFLVIRIGVSENVYNDTEGSEFDGHFADRIGFSIIPTPGGLALMALPMVLVAGRRRRREA